MPRKPRIDARGALHHIIARGIERTASFRDDRQRPGLYGDEQVGGVFTLSF